MGPLGWSAVIASVEARRIAQVDYRPRGLWSVTLIRLALYVHDGRRGAINHLESTVA